MRERHALPATHVAVTRIGADLVNSFVFYDGLAEPRGVAVLLTSSAAKSVLTIGEQIKSQSQGLNRSRATELTPPPAYVMVGDPIAAHSVTAVFADSSDVVVLGFREVDLELTIDTPEMDGERLQIQTSFGAFVTLSASVFVAWIAAISAHSEALKDDTP
jgi:hypothetical protein